mmetsp:Transcript_2159/g.7885  ORF Transcript_2159/g.7885 Transcript_2159/m.7885 type:complete len:81 (+) Transcript_2159:1501-1743(+)
MIMTMVSGLTPHDDLRTKYFSPPNSALRVVESYIFWHFLNVATCILKDNHPCMPAMRSVRLDASHKCIHTKQQQKHRVNV